MDKIRFVLKNELGELERISGELDVFLAKNSIPDDGNYKVHFVLEEMVSNIIKYAYRDSSVHDILLDISISADGINVAVEDDGLEFNPLNAPDKDTTLPLDEREIGGLGIHLVRKMARSMSYIRREGRNHLEVMV